MRKMEPLSAKAGLYIKAMENKIADYEAVLKWYTDENIYYDDGPFSPIVRDYGQKAKDVLAKYS